MAQLPADRCVVLVPAFSHIEPVCERALCELESRGYVVRREYGFSQIDFGRNVMASKALADGFEELMWIDADIAFEPDSVERLRQHDLPIVTGVYVKKGKRALALEALPGTERITFGQQGGLLPIRYAPGGFLLTRRCVYEEVQQKLSLPLCNERPDRKPAFVPYFQPTIVPDGDSTFYLGEDYAFCERARQVGFEILADTTLRLFHIGPYAYSWEDAGSDVTRFGTYSYQIVDVT